MRLFALLLACFLSSSKCTVSQFFSLHDELMYEIIAESICLDANSLYILARTCKHMNAQCRKFASLNIKSDNHSILMSILRMKSNLRLLDEESVEASIALERFLSNNRQISEESLISIPPALAKNCFIQFSSWPLNEWPLTYMSGLASVLGLLLLDYGLKEDSCLSLLCIFCNVISDIFASVVPCVFLEPKQGRIHRSIHDILRNERFASLFLFIFSIAIGLKGLLWKLFSQSCPDHSHRAIMSFFIGMAVSSRHQLLSHHLLFALVLLFIPWIFI